MHVVISEEKICGNLENSSEYHRAFLFFVFISAIGKSQNLGSAHFLALEYFKKLTNISNKSNRYYSENET